MRAYLLAFGLVAIVLGLFLLFAGYVGVGCSVGGTGANPTLSNCGAAGALEFGGAILTVAAIVLFVGAAVPERTAAYK